MNEEADLGPQGLGSLWRDIPESLKTEARMRLLLQQKDPGLQDPRSLSARVSSKNMRRHADSAPVPSPPSVLVISVSVRFSLLINVSPPRWCRQAAAGLRAPEGDPGHLASPVPEDAGSARAHAQRCGVSSWLSLSLWAQHAKTTSLGGTGVVKEIREGSLLFLGNRSPSLLKSLLSLKSVSFCLLKYS